MHIWAPTRLSEASDSKNVAHHAVAAAQTRSESLHQTSSLRQQVVVSSLVQQISVNDGQYLYFRTKLSQRINNLRKALKIPFFRPFFAKCRGVKFCLHFYKQRVQIFDFLKSYLKDNLHITRKYPNLPIF